jgi:hypothetical protein
MRSKTTASLIPFCECHDRQASGGRREIRIPPNVAFPAAILCAQPLDARILRNAEDLAIPCAADLGRGVKEGIEYALNAIARMNRDAWRQANTTRLPTITSAASARVRSESFDG